MWDSSFDLRILLGALLEVYRATLHVEPVSYSPVTAGAPAGRARAPRAAHLEREARIGPDFKSNLWMMFRMLLHELSVTRGIMSAVGWATWWGAGHDSDARVGSGVMWHVSGPLRLTRFTHGLTRPSLAVQSTRPFRTVTGFLRNLLHAPTPKMGGDLKHPLALFSRTVHAINFLLINYDF